MSVDNFLSNSWLMWSHQGTCTDYVVALESHPRDRARRRPQIMGKFDRIRLGGSQPYTHRPERSGCRHRQNEFKTTQHTRPFDKKARPDGLSPSEGFYLDLWDAKRGGQKGVTERGAQTFLKDVPIYTEMDASGKSVQITYWFFYGLSQPPGPPITKYFVHEGDWERISVLLSKRAANRYTPRSVRYYAHDGSRVIPWSAVKLVAAGDDLGQPTHPVAFSARGSHASYARSGRYANVFRIAGKPAFTVNDVAMACSRCPEWETWLHVIDARVQPWYGFGGAWGQVGTMAGTTGPLGPSSFKGRDLETAPENLVSKPLLAPTALRVDPSGGGL